MHLRAGMPDPPLTLRGQMEARIARKVAALTGISGRPDATADAGHGYSWYSDYRSLTATELSLGAPVVASPPPPERSGVTDSGLFRRSGSSFVLANGEPDPGHAPIPSVTLHAYGPDTKAALVLTGVNRILQSVTDAVVEALDEVRRQIDDECLLLAVTQTMVQEVFEAQRS